MRFHFYHKDTGLIHDKVVSCNLADPGAAEQFACANAPEDHVAIAGEFDRLSQKVDVQSGFIAAHQPDQPSDDHQWDSQAKRWHLSQDAADRQRYEAAARARIAHLEASVQPRAIREVQLSHTGSLKRLQDIDDEIAELRKQLGKG